MRTNSLGSMVSLMIPYVGKSWRRKILANLENGIQLVKFSSPTYIKFSRIIDRLPAHLSKFSSPIASSVMIRQKFPTPKFAVYGIQHWQSAQCIIVGIGSSMHFCYTLIMPKPTSACWQKLDQCPIPKIYDLLCTP